MVPRQAGYFGKPFLAERGVRVGDNVSPTIFNIVTDAVVRHYEFLHHPIQFEELLLFYIDDGAMTGTDPCRLQAGLDIMMRCFESFGLIMNADKTKSMVMSGGKFRVKQSTAAYHRHTTGEGPSFKERQLTKVQCIKCGAEVNRQYLDTHQRTPKCKKASLTYAPPTPVRHRAALEEVIITPRSDPKSYTMSIPRGSRTEISCPVEGCPFKVPGSQASKRGVLRKHFRCRHIEDCIRIEEEGLLPQCSKCGLFMKDANSEKHQNTAECKKFALRRDRYFRARRQLDAREVVFTVGGVEIDRVERFRYLGRILDENDDDSHALERQLSRARARWGRLAPVLRSQGVRSKTMGYFYKAVVQAVLLYGSETWVVTEFYLRQLRSWHSRIARYLTGRHIRQNEDGTWFCPPTADVLEEAGLRSVDEYIQKRRDTVRMKYVYGRPILNECRLSAAINNKAVWWKLD